MSQLRPAIILSYFNIILTNVVGLFLTPYIIKNFGNSEYGLYTLIGSFVAYLSLMELGLNNTVVRFVSKYRAEGKIEEEKRFLGTTMLIFLSISVLVLIIGAYLYFHLETIFGKGLSISQIEDAKIMFLILLFNIAVTLPGGVFSAICTAYGEFVFPKSLNLVKYILRSISVFAIVSFGGKAISLVLIDTIFNILAIAATIYYSISHLKVRFDFKKNSPVITKQIFSYSIWIFLLSIMQSFQWNAGQVILGFNLNTTVVAVYAIGLMLGGYFGAFSGVINTLLLPRAANIIAEKYTSAALTREMIRVGRMNSFISLTILSGFILFGKEFILLWVGDAYLQSWNIALIIMAATCIPLSQSLGVSILEIKDKVKFRAIGTLVTMTVAVLVGAYLTEYLGIYGILIPIAMAMFVNTIINNVLFIIAFKFHVRRFFIDVFFFQIVFSGFVLLIGILIKRYIQIDSWLEFLVSGSVFLFVYVMLFYLLILKSDEKQLMLKKIEPNAPLIS